MTSDKKVKLLSVGIALFVSISLALGVYAFNLKLQIDSSTNKSALTPDFDLQSNTAPSNNTQPFDPFSMSGFFDDSWPGQSMLNQMRAMTQQMGANFPMDMGGSMGFANLSVPKVELTENDEEYVVNVTIPEGQEVSLDTELVDNRLTISGSVVNRSKNDDPLGTNNHFMSQSMSKSKFSQTLPLPYANANSQLQIDDEGEGKITIKVPKA